MNKGLLVVNAFLKTNKFDDIYYILQNAAEKKGLSLDVLTNAEITAKLCEGSFQPAEYDFCLFWDKDVQLAKYLEQEGMRLFNSAEAILNCDDKTLTWLKLRKNPAIRLPETIPAPKTFPNIGYTQTDFLSSVANRLGFPMIVKECFGSFGKQVYLAKNMEQLQALTMQLQGTPFLYQKPVMESLGRDARINVVGNRVVASILRTGAEGDFRSNITLGGAMEPYQPTHEEETMAVLALKELGLDFAGVDVLFGKDGPIICEVNSNAHFKTTLECTGVNMADAIMNYICDSLKGR